MKNTFFASVAALLVAVALFAVPSADAQTYLSNTTLGAAVSSTSTTTVKVASATGITATNTMIFVDNEGMFVNAVSGNTLSVTRGYYGGRATTHANSALVWFGPPAAFGWAEPGGAPSGSCTRANIQYLPYINTDTGAISDCIGGAWVGGSGSTGSAGQFSVLYAPNPGAVIYTGINTNGTTLSATTMYCTEIDLQQSKLATGLAFLLGTTGATDKHISVLYDATGNLLANSATAGITAGTASTYEQLAFTSKYYMVGPAKYYGCLQTNGTTATVRMLITSVLDGFTTKGVTGQTFGTVPATITVPTTFTTAVGPYEQVY
jgi:hypothetical protein